MFQVPQGFIPWFFYFPTQKTRNVIAERDLSWGSMLVAEIPKSGLVSR